MKSVALICFILALVGFAQPNGGGLARAAADPSSYGAIVAASPDADAEPLFDLYTLNDTLAAALIAAEQRGGGRIAGGDLASAKSYPFASSLMLWGTHECGGSLIHPRVVMTAAHCIWNRGSGSLTDIRSLSLRIGSTKRSSGGYTRRAVRLVIPEQYQPTSYFGDIALVQLDAAVNTRRVKLSKSANPGSGSVTAIGWGFTGQGFLSDILRDVKLPKIANSICKNAHKRYSMPAVPKDHFCAGLGRGGADTCVGDSGGPVLTSRAVGITSYGPDGITCGAALRNIGAYTSVGYWRDWIEDSMSLYNMRGSKPPSRRNSPLFNTCIEAGTTLRTLTTKRSGSCADVCRARSTCKAWSWTKSSGRCVLKGSGYRERSSSSCHAGTLS